MKTTIDISDSLYKRCKDIVRRDQTSIRTLVEEGLHVILDYHDKPKKFTLNPVVFKGKGLNPEFESKGWNAIRDEIYQGHSS